MAKFRFRKPKLQLPKFNFFRRRFRQISDLTRKRPITSLLAALTLLLLLILAGNFFFTPKAAPISTGPAVKQAQIYTIGSVPKVTTQAQIQNSGVITINALSSGVVQSIKVVEGQQVFKNTNLITLSSNYDGASAPGIQLGIVAKQLQQLNDNLPSQKELIQKQREQANSTEQNSSGLKDISAKSIVDLQAIADLNQNMLDTVKTNITNLQALPTDPATTAQILQLKQLQNQLQNAQNQTHQNILNTQFQTKPSNPPTQLNNLQKEITLKQLDLQEKGLQTTKEIAQLQVALAAVNAALLHPTAPFGAAVQKIMVREGQAVNPGTPLVVLSSNSQNITVIAKVAQTMANQVSQVEDSTLHLGKTNLSLKPSFVSDVATDGLLYSVIYTIPDGFTTNLTDNDYITVDVPVGLPSTSSSIPFVPLDSIFQTRDHSYLYINNHGVVESRSITTGQVLGSFVEIVEGLKSGDQVILNRNVVEGDRLIVTQ